MEPTDSHPAASLPSRLDNPTDRMICGLLSAEPMTSPDLAARLVVPARTVRHRLMRLRDAGTVTVGNDGFYRIAGLAPAGLPPVATSGSEPAAVSATPATAFGLTEIAVVGALAACCVAAAIWAARRDSGGQHPSPTQTKARFLPAAGLPWPNGIDGWRPGAR
jgi:predicted DNA-binding transcriptional regulator YafY